jgi:hypothetical protein
MDGLENIYHAALMQEIALCAKPEDARIIAAAPDLLDALRPLVAIVNGAKVHKLKRMGYLEAARAAIAKAVENT